MSSSGFGADFKWQRRFMPEIKRILGEHLISEAPFEEDAKHNTDLLVLQLTPYRIACRTRKHRYLKRWPDEFTIRSNRPSGQDTELAKLLQGWGDYLFYGFADEDESSLAAWMIGDLKVFRIWFYREMHRLKGATPGQANSNDDGSSDFVAFKIADLPKEFVVARQEHMIYF